VLVVVIPFFIYTIRSIAEEYGYFTILEWLIFGLPILIIGGLLIYSLRGKKQIESTLLETPKAKIKRVRLLLLMFVLLWIVLGAWKSQFKKYDFPNLPLKQLITISLVEITRLICLVMTSIYVYKLYKWYNSSKAPALPMTIIYVIFWFIFPLISILIVSGIIWESRRLLIENEPRNLRESTR